MDIVIETERLILRALQPKDAESLFLLDSNPNVHLYLGNNPVKSIGECSAYIEHIQSQYIQNGIGRFAVVLKQTNEVIGWSGLKFIREPENNHVNFYEIGYRLREEYWGQGYGFESAKAWLDYGFEEMNIKTMYASANIENIGSRKILTKIGLKEKNTFDWNGIPCLWYELNASDYNGL